MNINDFITRLDGVRRTCTDKYFARCPVHADRKPSLSIREREDGQILVHCFAGCSTVDVLAAVGLGYPDLFLDGGKKKEQHGVLAHVNRNGCRVGIGSGAVNVQN